MVDLDSFQNWPIRKEMLTEDVLEMAHLARAHGEDVLAAELARVAGSLLSSLGWSIDEAGTIKRPSNSKESNMQKTHNAPNDKMEPSE